MDSPSHDTVATHEAGSPDDATPDSTAPDLKATDAAAQGSINCDGKTCGADEYCVITCLCCGMATDAAPQSESACHKIPAGCKAQDVCSCPGLQVDGHCDQSNRTFNTLCA